MEGFPYEPRPGQVELADAIRAAQAGRRHLVAEAGTGTGKTVTALYASLQTVQRDGRRLIYLTRTNSQQAQVVREHAGLRANTLLVPLMGRRHHCPLLKDDERFSGGSPEELGRLCKHAKQKALESHAAGHPVEGACPYYLQLLHDGPGPVEAILRDGGAGDAGQRVAAAGSCPYEAFKLLLPDAHIVVAPYVYLLDVRLRQALLQWMGVAPDHTHVVVDEAHNLSDATRDHHSPRLGLATIERAIREAERLQDPLLAGEVLATSFLAALHRVLRDLVHEHAGDQDDGWMPPDALDEALMTRLRLPSTTIQRIASSLDEWGEVVREARRTEGKLPRSHLGAVGAFLHMWQEVRDGPFVHLALREPRPALEAYLLDPASRLAWLEEHASTVHMSGTLAPVRDHAIQCGMPDADQLELPSPFASENLRVYGMHGMQRSRRALLEDPTIVERQQAAARALLERWQGRIGVWFPSHEMLRNYMEEGFLHGIAASIYVEEPGMTTPELMALVERFRSDTASRAMLLGVLGGRLTEGIDYPGKAMEHMLLLGVPYPRPSARSQALIHHLGRYGDGWRLAVHGPVGRTMKQAIGRLIRGPDDEGTAAVLDERMMRFRDRFPHLQMVAEAARVVDQGVARPSGFLPGSSL